MRANIVSVCMILAGFLILVIAIWLPNFGNASPLEISPGELDFGHRDYFDLASQTITLRNAGSRPLPVSLIADCSCVALSEDRIELQPGKKHDVSVTLQKTGGILKGEIRQIEKELHILAGLGPQNVEQILRLRGSFYEPFAIDLQKLHVRAPFLTGQVIQIPISANSEGTEKPTITKFPSFLKQALFVWNDEFHAGNVELTPSLAEPLPEGTFFVSLNFGRDKTLELPITITRESSHFFEPDVAIFEGDTQEVELRINRHAKFAEECSATVKQIKDCPGIHATVDKTLVSIVRDKDMKLQRSSLLIVEFQIMSGEHQFYEEVKVPIISF